MKIPSWLRTSENDPLLDGILDFIAVPVLLVSGRTGRIRAANLEAARQGSISRPALVGMPLERLFPTLEWDPSTASVNDLHTKVTLLLESDGTSREILWQARALDDQGEHWLVMFTPYHASAQATEPPSPDKTAMHPSTAAGQRLTQALAANDPLQALQYALEGSTALMSAAWGALYLSEEPAFHLKAQVGALPPLPPRLSLQYADLFAQPQRHRPQQKAPTPLHAVLPQSKTPFLLTVPIRDGQGLMGFLAFGYYRTPPSAMLGAGEITADYFRQVLLHIDYRKQIAEANFYAQRAHAVNQAIVQHSWESILVFDENLRLVAMNPAAEQTLGYQSEEVPRAPLADLVLAEIPLEETAQKALALAAPQEIDTHLLRRDGSEFPAVVRIAPYLLKEGERPQGVVVLINDLSNEERYRQQNNRLMRRAMLGDILASFTHEVRDPLNSISTGLEWLEYNLQDNPSHQKTIQDLQQDVERLSHLVNNLLDFSKTRTWQLKPVDLVSLLEQLLRRWQHRFQKYGIQTELYAEPDAPPVHGDRLSLEQVFANLINNAIHALADHEGERFIAIRVTSMMEAGTRWVEVSVADTGPGFSDEVRRRLFEPFFTTKEQGTGLGLTITKQIVTAHKGSIEAHSYPDGGTIFRVRLRAAGDNAHGV
ncbi:MAG: PAS domain-containing protein [Chloroflexi bacterium]|nr:PAS domain-containing protein [Chloroflexota bacterium]